MVDLPLWKIWKSIGIIIPNIWKYGKIKNVPNHQPGSISYPGISYDTIYNPSIIIMKYPNIFGYIIITMYCEKSYPVCPSISSFIPILKTLPSGDQPWKWKKRLFRSMLFPLKTHETRIVHWHIWFYIPIIIPIIIPSNNITSISHHWHYS